MAIAEILTTKKECFVIFENGRIHMTKGKYTPSKPNIYDVYPKPDKPEPGPIALVQHNIWGEEIYRENAEIRAWRIQCEKIDEMNAQEHKKQKKTFKEKLAAVRRSYYRQEKQRRKEAAKERKTLVKRRKDGVRTYVERLFQHQK